MYQSRARHPLSSLAPSEPQGVEDAMWHLFVAVGEFWKLGDDPAGYRERFKTFMDNRISLNPIYEGLYAAAKRMIDDLTAELGSPGSAYEAILTRKDRKLPSGPPESELEFIQVYVANEFIALRLALGGFLAFGALNYCGYFGGGNIPGQPAPYRTF
jgi:hypothetical protein